MHVNWSTVAKVGLNVAGAVLPQVNIIEAVAKSIPGLSGKAKEDAAVELTKQAVEAAESVAGKELLSDPAVEAAVRSFIEAYVALQNVVSQKPGAGQSPATPTSSPALDVIKAVAGAKQ